MNRTKDLERENRQLRERLSRMGQASLRINESLDFETVLQGVLDSARSLTDAKYGMMTLLKDDVRIQNCLSSGLTPNQTRRIWRTPENEVLFRYFAFINEPLRLRDMHSHTRSLGLPEFRPPMRVSPLLTFLVAPIRHRGERVGTFFLAKKEEGRVFTVEDEETLVLFASQAALVITNARRYRDEQRARADLEALIKTSPVGVAVFEAGTGEVISSNREASRILDGLRTPDRHLEDLLDVLTVRRGDGREISLEELSVARVLSRGETTRAEEVVLKVPDGRSVTVLINATPIRSDDGGVESFVVTLQDMTHLEEMDRQRSDFLAVVSHFTIPVAEDAGNMTQVATVPDAGCGRAMRQARTPILVVDDDPQTLRNVREGLANFGYVTVATGDPDEVPALLEEHRPHLVLLDLVLPGTDGIEMMQSIFNDAGVPVIFLSAYGRDEAIARAFEAGAVDYVVKPYSPTELLARIRAALRRTAAVQTEPDEPFTLGDLAIDYARRRVTVGGRSVKLTVIEYRLLVELSVSEGVILTHEDLLQKVWRKRSGRDTRPIRTAIKSLRRKLGDDAANPTYIFNEPRVGYRMGSDE